VTHRVSELAFAGTSRFAVLRKLGEGGMGVVYEARDHDRGMNVAIKTLRHIDTSSVSRFKNEFRALADLSHPNLVRLGELFCEDSQWFFTMELLEGKTFVAHIRGQDGTPYDEVRLRAALAQLALGVCALHRANLVHRDIKPSNVLVTDPGRVVLLDFGLAAEEHRETHDDTPGVYGTATYMAPEQGASQSVGPGADWYSVGVVLYEALTGRLPFSGTPLEILLGKEQRAAQPPHTVVPTVPPDLDLLCQELLRRDPRERPNEKEVLERLGITTPPADPDSGGSLLSLTKAPHFVGRTEELALLGEAFRDSHTDRRAVTLLVHGESGLGKTALVRHFLERLEERDLDVLVLEGRCYEREMVPYKAFDGLVEALSRHLARLAPARAAPLLPRDVALLARIFPAMRRIAWVSRVAAPSVPNPQELRARGFAALRELLVRMADRQPLVLVIDDFQWVDADSLSLFYELTRPPDSPAVTILATIRSATEAPAKGPLSFLADLPGDVRHVALAPLSPKEAAALAELALPEAQRRSQDIEALAREAAGHPLFLLELSRHAVLAGDGERPPIRLDEALWSRVQALEEEGRTLVEVLAVASAPLSQAEAGAAAQLDAVPLARWIALLRAANLCRTTGPHSSDLVETYHDRVRDAVLAHLPAETQRLHHGRLADTLEATRTDDSDRTALVRHLEAIGETARAAEHAERAAGLASDALAFDQAVRLLRTALRLGVHDRETTRALERRLGDALANGGRGGEAAVAYEAAAQGASADEALDLERRAAEQFLMSGHVDKGLVVLARVLSSVGMKLQYSSGTALAYLLMRRAWLRIRGRSYQRRQESAVPASELARLDTCWTAAIGLAAVDVLRGADFQTHHFLLALQTGEPYRIARSLGGEAAFLAMAGPHDRRRAVKLAQEAQVLAQQIEHAHALSLAYIASGITELMSGSWKTARSFCEKANLTLREHCTGVAWEIATMHVTWVTCLFYLGEITEFTRQVTLMLRESEERGDRYAQTLMRTGIATHLWLMRDQPDRARQHAEEATRSWSRHGLFVHHYLDLRAHVEIDLYQGQALAGWNRLRLRWKELSRAHMLYVQQFRIEMYFLRARTALAAATTPGLDASRRRRLVRSAEHDARRLEREKMAWSDALALLASAGVAALRGDTTRAAERLALARTAFEAEDMAFHAAVATRRLGELLGEHGGQALVQETDAWMTKQGIRSPLRMTALMTGGATPREP
jgi:hypothetical protein